MVSPKKFLKSLGLYELDRQSQTRRRGCHCWELQGEPLSFCRRIGTACVGLLYRVFSTHLIGFLMRATKQEQKSALKKLRCCVSQDTKAVYSASERKYTAAGGDVQVPWVILTIDVSQNKGIDTRVRKANAVLRELYCSMVTKGALSKHAKLSVFKSVFLPILTCGHNSLVTTERILSKEQTAEMGYLRRVLGVTLRDKKHRRETRKAQDVKPLLRIERSQLC